MRGNEVTIPRQANIARLAAFEGKTAHALMVDTWQSAMEDAWACMDRLGAIHAASQPGQLGSLFIGRSDKDP